MLLENSLIARRLQRLAFGFFGGVVFKNYASKKPFAELAKQARQYTLVINNQSTNN